VEIDFGEFPLVLQHKSLWRVFMIDGYGRWILIGNCDLIMILRPGQTNLRGQQRSGFAKFCERTVIYVGHQHATVVESLQAGEPNPVHPIEPEASQQSGCSIGARS